MRVLGEPFFPLFYLCCAFLRPFIYFPFAVPFLPGMFPLGYVPLGAVAAVVQVWPSQPKAQEIEDRPGSNGPNSLVAAFETQFGGCPGAGWAIVICFVAAAVFFLDLFSVRFCRCYGGEDNRYDHHCHHKHFTGDRPCDNVPTPTAVGSFGTRHGCCPRR